MHRRLLATISLTDLPRSYELNEGWGNSGRVKQGDDVFVLVKEYICSAELRQDPMLVLKKEVMDLYPKEVLAPLPFHTSAEMMPAVPAPEYQPHEVVLGVLAPTVPLRAVWRRRRAGN